MTGTLTNTLSGERNVEMTIAIWEIWDLYFQNLDGIYIYIYIYIILYYIYMLPKQQNKEH